MATIQERVTTEKIPQRQIVDTNKSPFSTEGYVYPLDLLEEEHNRYGNSYVIFTISTHQESTIARDAAGGSMAGISNTTNTSNTLDGQSNFSKQTSQVIGSAWNTAGATIVAKAAGFLDGVKSLFTAAPVVVASGATVVSATSGNTASYTKARNVIALHIPNDLATKYGVSWEENPDLQGLSQMAGIIDDGMNFNFGGAMNKFGTAVSSGNVPILSNLVKGNVTSMSQKMTGTVPNPRKEVLFKEVGFRTFTFSYQFSPRSSDESLSVKNIIKSFKLHMHPEYSDKDKFKYIYPSVFDIDYYIDGEINSNIHKHKTCVLTDLNVSYAPNATFSTFADGMPTQINVQMTFKELGTLSNEDIQGGF